MFCALSSYPQNAIGCANLDVWPTELVSTIGSLPQSARLKFGVQYNRLLIGFVWLNLPNPTFTYIKGFHLPLVFNQADAIPLEVALSSLDDPALLPKEVEPVILSKFLSFIGVNINKVL